MANGYRIGDMHLKTYLDNTHNNRGKSEAIGGEEGLSFEIYLHRNMTLRIREMQLKEYDKLGGRVSLLRYITQNEICTLLNL